MPFFCLLRRGDAETDGTGHLGALADQCHNGIQICLDLVSGSGHAQTGYHIDESFCLGSDHGDPVFRGRRDHGDQVHTVLLTIWKKLLLFLIRNIRQDQSINADFLANRDEILRPIGIYHVIPDKMIEAADGIGTVACLG